MAIIVARIGDAPVPDSPGKWRNGEVQAVFDDGFVFGSSEVPEAGNCYHVTVTDKTKAEVEGYMQAWNHEPTTTQVQHDGNDNRRIEVVSDMVSASGKNAFTQEGVFALLADINGTYVSHSQQSFRFDIHATIEERDEIIFKIEEAVRQMQHARRRWYINQSGRDFMDANNNQASGPASTVTNYLRDGLLD